MNRREIIAIPLERNRKPTGYYTILTPMSAGDDPISPTDEQIIYWHGEAVQLRETLRTFYDKVRHISDDPKWAFTATDLERARELLEGKQ